jgi:Putative methyltransferase
MKDWVAWHLAYDDPASSLSLRLERVRAHLARAIDQAPSGPIKLISLCAGQGRDVLDVLPGHPRRNNVAALLVESDPRNAEFARQRAAAAGLSQVQVRQADASLVANFADMLPADVLLLAGIFGNVSNADIRRMIDAAPALCADGATVIWTRHRRPPDMTVQMREWFAVSGFDELAFDALETEAMTSVGVHGLARRAASAWGHPDQPLFSFGSHRS